MTPSYISLRIVGSRLQLIADYLGELRALPLADQHLFIADPRNVAAAESFLRRALEALLDIGRHMLAKGFAIGASEYKDIARQLGQSHVLDAEETALPVLLAGYRNRMVHFYHEITPNEMYSICSTQLTDIERIADAYRRWMNTHPERIDTTL